MSRRSAAARARSRRTRSAGARAGQEHARVKPVAASSSPSRARPSAAPARGRGTSAPQTELAPEEAIAVYRGAARYGWRARIYLAAGLGLLVATSVARTAGSPLPAEVGGLGIAFIFAFVAVSVARHFRALYRMRRAAVWSNTGRFMLLMAGAPFGALDPGARRRDRILVRVIIVLAVLLLVASVAGGITRR